MTSTETAVSRWEAVMMDNYGTPKLALARGEGAYVWDSDGSRYLDLVAGIAVNALGHAHPAVVAAVSEQVRTLGHTSNLYLNGPALAVAERLLELDVDLYALDYADDAGMSAFAERRARQFGLHPVVSDRALSRL